MSDSSKFEGLSKPRPKTTYTMLYDQHLKKSTRLLSPQSPALSKSIPASITAAGSEKKHTQLVSPLVIVRVQRTVADMFGWRGGCMLRLVPSKQEAESHSHPLVISSDEQLGAIIRSWRICEERRRVDVVETTLAKVHAVMWSSNHSLHYAGCHIMWDIASKPHQHVQVACPPIPTPPSTSPTPPYQAHFNSTRDSRHLVLPQTPLPPRVSLLVMRRYAARAHAGDKRQV